LLGGCIFSLYMLIFAYTAVFWKEVAMTLNTKVKVPLPDKGVIVRSGGKRYVYKVLETFRNDKNQPTNKNRLIGRLDPESGMLIPNNAYYEFYGFTASIEMVPEQITVKSAGAAFLLSHILTSLGVSAILDKVLGQSRAMAVITSAIYMACRGNVFERVLNWWENSLIYDAPLSSQKASKLFASITYDERMGFFRKWVEQHEAEGYLVYDVTSFSTHAEGISDSERGYNRDNDNLPQINLGCYLLEHIGLPLFYVTYPGSIVDKSHLPYMMAYNDELGIKDLIFVMDRGFCTAPNLTWMHSEKKHYIVSVDMSHKIPYDAVDQVRSTIVSLRNYIESGVFGEAVHSSFYGVEARMHVYFSHTLAIRHTRSLQNSIEKLEKELKALSTLNKKGTRRYERYFNIYRNEDGTFTFDRNYEKIDMLTANCGFFCLLSNTDLSTSDILAAYNRRDTIEKGFDDVKNHLDMKRLRTHKNATTDGKLFCAFIALIAISELMQRLKEFLKVNSMSKHLIISELEKIKTLELPDSRRLINPLTKKQRELLEAFGLGENEVKAYAAKK